MHLEPLRLNPPNASQTMFWRGRTLPGISLQEIPIRTFAFALAALSLSGCASLTTPSTEKIAALPVLEMGQTAPADHEYILHIAAGKPIPFVLEVAGDAVAHPVSASTVVESRKDIYLYKYWASLDGKTWQPTHKLFKTEFSVGLDTQGGKAAIRLDEAAR